MSDTVRTKSSCVLTGKHANSLNRSKKFRGNNVSQYVPCVSNEYKSISMRHFSAVSRIKNDGEHLFRLRFNRNNRQVFFGNKTNIGVKLINYILKKNTMLIFLKDVI